MVELDNNFRIEVSIGNASAGKENITKWINQVSMKTFSLQSLSKAQA